MGKSWNLIVSFLCEPCLPHIYENTLIALLVLYSLQVRFSITCIFAPLNFFPPLSSIYLICIRKTRNIVMLLHNLRKREGSKWIVTKTLFKSCFCPRTRRKCQSRHIHCIHHSAAPDASSSRHLTWQRFHGGRCRVRKICKMMLLQILTAKHNLFMSFESMRECS